MNFYLYYNSDGTVKFYTMEKQASGDFILVTAEQYNEGRYDIKVIDGKIRYKHTSSKLIPIKTANSTSCDPEDVTIVVPTSQSNLLWDIKHYYK